MGREHAIWSLLREMVGGGIWKVKMKGHLLLRLGCGETHDTHVAYVAMEGLDSVCRNRHWILGIRESVTFHLQTNIRDPLGRVQSVGGSPQSALEGLQSL